MLRSPLTAAGLLLVALVVAAVTFERGERWRRLRSIAGSRSVPGEAVGSTRFGRALGELDLLHAVPRGRRHDAPATALGPIPAEGGSIPDQLTLRRPSGRRVRTAYWLKDVPAAERAPTLSLLVPDADLKRMHDAPFLRGRESEHAAYMGFFDRGELVVGGGTGVRIHGGGSRENRAFRNYRLTARRRYGASSFSPAPFRKDPDTAASQLVLRLNRGRDRRGRLWFFMSPLALDVVRQVGAPAPRSRPVLFVLNGRAQGVYELCDYIGPGFVEARFGLRDFILVRTKLNRNEGDRSRVKEGPEEPYLEFRQRVTSLEDEAAERADEWVDLDNLYRWLIAVTFLDTLDVYQGALVRDLSEPSARWFWIAWDLDISFGLPHLPIQDSWRTNSLASRLRKPRRDGRRHLFQWLMKSPEQRRRFVELAAEVLNHRLDRGFLSERIAYYRGQAALFAIEDLRFLDEMEEYLLNRSRAYRRHLQEVLDSRPLRSVQVDGPPGTRVEIDGYPEELPWSGEYFDGMSVRLKAPTGVSLSVNGTPPPPGPELLELKVTEDLVIAL